MPKSFYYLYIFVYFALNRQNTAGMDIKIIGTTIRERRKFLKISQEDLADIAGIAERTLRDIEKGIANPELASLIKLCEVLGLQIQIEVIK